MYTRVHTFKFQNKLAKNAIMQSIKELTDINFKKGLQFRYFVEIDDNTLILFSIWDSEETFLNVSSSHADFRKDIKEMGIKMTSTGGKTNGSYSDLTDLSLLKKLS